MQVPSTLGRFFKKKSPELNNYLSLTLTPNEVLACIWTFNPQNEVEILGFGQREFTNVDSLNSAGVKMALSKLKFSLRQKPIVAQIWGTNPETFFKSANIIKDLGFDGVDINMGCPVRAVVKTGACSALINNRPLVKEIISATQKGANNLPVSVKTRIGVKEAVTNDWITFLLEQNIDALTIHGRTARQMSDVPANWEEIAKAVEIKNATSPHTVVIGNGDVKSYDQILEYHKKYKVDGVMIGRGIFSNPWVFDKNNSKTHSQQEYKEILLKHLSLLRPDQNYESIKKFFKMYINSFKGASALRFKLMATKNVSEASDLLK